MLIAVFLVGFLASFQSNASLTPGYSQDGVTYMGSELTDSNDGLYTHRIKAAYQDKTIEVMWKDHASSFYDIKRVDWRIAFLGKVGSSSDSISVVDLSKTESSLFVLCRDPKASPNGHVIVYLNFVPRHAPSAGTQDILLALDLTKLPVPRDRNTKDDWVVESANRGTVVYPAMARGKRVFPLASESPSQVILDGAWADDYRFVALIFSEGTLRLVESTFHSAAVAPTSRVIRTFRNGELVSGKAGLSLADLHSLQLSMSMKDGNMVVVRSSSQGSSRELLIPIAR